MSSPPSSATSSVYFHGRDHGSRRLERDGGAGHVHHGRPGLAIRGHGHGVRWYGIVAVFGAPTADEDDPYRAVRSGMEIVRAMGEIEGRGLEVRVGIHTSLVVVGDVSAGDLRKYSALGDTLNVASRLQDTASPGTVVVSAETRRLLGSDVEARLLGLA